MARHVFHRDFSLGKAAVLAALMGLAWLVGAVPTPRHDIAQSDALSQVHRASSVTMAAESDCDWRGVAL